MQYAVIAIIIYFYLGIYTRQKRNGKAEKIRTLAYFQSAKDVWKHNVLCSLFAVGLMYMTRIAMPSATHRNDIM